MHPLVTQTVQANGGRRRHSEGKVLAEGGGVPLCGHRGRRWINAGAHGPRRDVKRVTEGESFLMPKKAVPRTAEVETIRGTLVQEGGGIGRGRPIPPVRCVNLGCAPRLRRGHEVR
jgi:hypothetical protein